MDTVRAVYEHGQLRLLDPVDLTEGQTVDIAILSERDRVRLALGDLVGPPETDDRDSEVESYAKEIEAGFSGTRPLSEIIIEERGTQL